MTASDYVMSRNKNQRTNGLINAHQVKYNHNNEKSCQSNQASFSDQIKNNRIHVEDNAISISEKEQLHLPYGF